MPAKQASKSEKNMLILVSYYLFPKNYYFFQTLKSYTLQRFEKLIIFLFLQNFTRLTRIWYYYCRLPNLRGNYQVSLCFEKFNFWQRSNLSRVTVSPAIVAEVKNRYFKKYFKNRYLLSTFFFLSYYCISSIWICGCQ